MLGASGFLLERHGSEVLLRAASNEEQVKESIRAILLTRRGERSRRPELGSDLYRCLFRPMNDALRAEIQEEVRNSLTQCESRIEVREVTIGSSNGEASQLELRVEFTYRQSSKKGLVKVVLHA